MIERKVVIKNKYGLHARPAALFVQEASKYSSDVTIGKEGLEVNGKSIMGVMMLAAEKGEEVTIKASGKDEADMARALIALLEGNLDGEE